MCMSACLYYRESARAREREVGEGESITIYMMSRKRGEKLWHADMKRKLVL
jgi:hypothetical protein